jgi:hypothetical protein
MSLRREPVLVRALSPLLALYLFALLVLLETRLAERRGHDAARPQEHAIHR